GPDLVLGAAHPARTGAVLGDAAARRVAVLVRTRPAGPRGAARAAADPDVGGGSRLRRPVRLRRLQGPSARSREGRRGRRGARDAGPGRAGQGGLSRIAPELPPVVAAARHRASPDPWVPWSH